MSALRALVAAAALLGAWAPLRAQEAAPAPAAAAEPAEEKSSRWSFSLAAYGYVVPEDRDYVQPTFMADRGSFHLETRYNYEDMSTTSLWAGYTFSWGEKTTVDLTLMGGAVAGHTEGFAPGFELTLAHRKLELYVEAEHVFASSGSDDEFTYTWTELGYSPVEWFRFGVLDQRTWLKVGGLEWETGPMIGFTAGAVDFSAYATWPEEGDPTLVLGVEWGF